MQLHLARAFLCALLSPASALLLASLAAAQSSKLKNMELCNDFQNISADLQINGCTALIQVGGLMPQGVAIAHNNRGNAYQRRGDYDRAIDDYIRALNSKPDYAEAFNNRGVAHYKKKAFGRAIQDFDRAVELKPD